MKRITITSALLIILSGCASAPPPCQGYTGVAYQQCMANVYQSRRAMGMALMNMSNNWPQQRRPVNTTCRQIGNQVRCTTW